MKYLVDSFQLFLPCDNRLSHWLHQNDLNQTVAVRKQDRSTLPIIYCDNTLSTIKKPHHLRKYAFPAEFFDQSSFDLGWRNQWNGVTIPSEKFFIDINDLGDTIRITADDTSQYHLEYKYKVGTDMGSWENWFAIYLPVPTAIRILKDLQTKFDKKDLMQRLIHEKKQTTGKREDFYYSSLPVAYYQFTYESFTHAKQFLLNQGFNGDFKGISYDGSSKEVSPFMKIGYVHTKETDGDFNRNPQIAIKLSQRMLHQETRLRGDLSTLETTTNYIDVNKRLFIKSMMSALFQLYKGVHKDDATRKIKNPIVSNAHA